jgi:hypothetical protein
MRPCPAIRVAGLWSGCKKRASESNGVRLWRSACVAHERARACARKNRARAKGACLPARSTRHRPVRTSSASSRGASRTTSQWPRGPAAHDKTNDAAEERSCTCGGGTRIARSSQPGFSSPSGRARSAVTSEGSRDSTRGTRHSNSLNAIDGNRDKNAYQGTCCYDEEAYATRSSQPVRAGRCAERITDLRRQDERCKQTAELENE